MSGFQASLERLELKYLIDEAVAGRIRRDVAAYCRPDRPVEPGAAHGRRGYPISSLYLDSPGLVFHRAKERGDPERIKLRIRTYGDESPAVLEVKRRSADVVDKQRVRVHRAEVERAARGRPLDIEPDPASRRRLDRFARLVAEYGAEPTLRVRYWREAWESDVDDYARVTFDRNIEARRTRAWARDDAAGPERWIAFDEHWAPELEGAHLVLEIKCHTTVPWWVTDLVRRYALRRCSFSKYSIGIALSERQAGNDGLLRRSARAMR